MVCAMPIYDMVVMFKKSFLFWQILEDLPLAVGVHPRCRSSGDWDSSWCFRKESINLKAWIIFFLLQRHGDVEFVARVQRIEVSLWIDNSFCSDLHKFLLLKEIFTNRKSLVRPHIVLAIMP